MISVGGTRGSRAMGCLPEDPGGVAVLQIIPALSTAVGTVCCQVVSRPEIGPSGSEPSRRSSGPVLVDQRRRQPRIVWLRFPSELDGQRNG
jgi:hypothetical protein